ncbi:MAG: VTT domain-containing protein [Pseudomonadota bacterium]
MPAPSYAAPTAPAPALAADISPGLHQQLTATLESCLACGLCQRECRFLQEHGQPLEIARSFDPLDNRRLALAFQCSLCGLCAEVCPHDLNPSALFLEMRREAVLRGEGDFAEHQGLLAFERRGNSPRYTWYALPQGCHTVFFPGCNLPGSRPGQTWRIFEHLRANDPSLGMVLDCCNKPSHDLGRQDYFLAMFQEMRDWLLERGVKQVLVACPNCYRVFETHGQDLEVRTVYEVLAEQGPPQAPALAVATTVTLHDSCAVRWAQPVQEAARQLASQAGLTVREMPHHGARTLCCGEGGGVGFLSPELAQAWVAKRRQEAGQERVLTYCAGCAGMLGGSTPTSHLLDVLLDPRAALAGRAPVAKAPLTYWNRLRLKKRLQRQVPAAQERRRAFNPLPQPRGGLVKLLLMLALLVGVVAAARLSGAAGYLEQERLRALIAGYGSLAPAIYMLIYAVAPALFLPGLPITLAGGILFGPLWGVVYTIIGSTSGACLAFLVARHGARASIERRLRSPRWRQLDAQVERHGWKVVVFTRLIPLFPFNLLNYALGLTKVKFSHYALATFLGMLPACIAFVVFSSSLLDLILGRVSPRLALGLGLVILVSLAPLLYRRLSRRKPGAPAPETPAPR